MNNLRKFKKKKRTKIQNPEEIAQQKLFECSRFQDEEEINEPDTFLENLKPKHTLFKQSPTHKHSKTEHMPDLFHYQTKKQRICATFSLNQLKQKIGSYRKQPLSITNFVVIDERDKKCIHQHQTRMVRYDCVSIMKRKASMAAKMSVGRGLKINRSCDFKNEFKDRIKIIRNEVSTSIQVKNIKLFSKYPSFFMH